MLFAEGKATENSIKRARTHIVGEYLIIPGRSVDSDPRRDRKDFPGKPQREIIGLRVRSFSTDTAEHPEHCEFSGLRVLRVKLLEALPAEAMGEVSRRSVADVSLKNLPLAVLVTDFLARCTDGQQAAQQLYLAEGSLEFVDQVLAFGLGVFSATDVAKDDATKLIPFSIREDDRGYLDGKCGSVGV